MSTYIVLVLFPDKNTPLWPLPEVQMTTSTSFSSHVWYSGLKFSAPLEILGSALLRRRYLSVLSPSESPVDRRNSRSRLFQTGFVRKCADDNQHLIFSTSTLSATLLPPHLPFRPLSFHTLLWTPRERRSGALARGYRGRGATGRGACSRTAPPVPIILH